MMKQNIVHRSMWNGGMRHSGSKNQALAPVVYEYRKPHRQGKPGYYSLKSFYTLGCFPSGLESPYRLNDFHKYYLRSFLPEILDDWLEDIRPHPIEVTFAAWKALKAELHTVILSEATKWRPKPVLTHLNRISQPLEEVINTFMDDRIRRKNNTFYPFVSKKSKSTRLQIPNVVTRHLLNNHFNELTELIEILDETWDFLATSRHRQGSSHVTQSLLLPSNCENSKEFSTLANEKESTLMGKSNVVKAKPLLKFSSDGESTSNKPKKPVSLQKNYISHSHEHDVLLIYLNNLLAQAASEAHEYDLGISLTQISLFSHANDDILAAKAHCDLAKLWYKKGEYETSIVHAQRAVILGEYGKHVARSEHHDSKPEKEINQPQKLACLHIDYEERAKECTVVDGYILWSTALAQQDHLDDALIIAARCRENKPHNQDAISNLGKLQRFACGRITTPLAHRSLRCYSIEKVREGVDGVPFKLVHHSVVNRSSGYQWMFWGHPIGLKYKYDPRGF